MTIRYPAFFLLICFIATAALPGFVPGEENSNDITVEQSYPGLATHILKSAKLIPLEKGLLLKSDGIEVHESQIKRLVEDAEPGIRPQLEKNLFFLLEQEAMKRLLVREAQRAGIAIKSSSEEDQVIQSYLDRAVQGLKVSDKEAKTFYDDNRAMVQDMPFDRIKDTIKQVLFQQKRRQAIDDHVRDLILKTSLKVNGAWVKRQYASATDNPVDRARQSGKHTMVEFGANGCVPCDMMQPILDNLKKKYPHKLNVVFVNVRENYILGSRYSIRSIPVQVFFDREGKEVFRHTGFYAEADISKQLSKMGID